MPPLVAGIILQLGLLVGAQIAAPGRFFYGSGSGLSGSSAQTSIENGISTIGFEDMLAGDDIITATYGGDANNFAASGKTV